MSRKGNLRTERAVDSLPNAHRLTAVSTQPSNACASRTGSVTAENGNTYTVMISDDGAFTAEYVQPPALSVPLGISGSTVQARINEDRTFSVMIDGEWVVVTADTQVTAANGNVYGVQFVDGIPMPVYTGHSQPVMLGDLGGEVTLTRAEDMTWWLGETEVTDGYVHTASNGNMYVLMMDAEGMWSAMYQKVDGDLCAWAHRARSTLERAENMSWWLRLRGSRRWAAR